MAPGAAQLSDPMREALVILGAAAVVIPLFHRLRVSPVIGYMLVGLLAGPSGLGALTDWAPWLSAITITDPARIAPVADLGVVLLLFMIGLELSFERIVSLRRLVFGLGAAQVACCTTVLAGAAWLAGAPRTPAIVVGLALAMSSTAIVTQVLAEGRRVTGRVGRTSFAILLFQDLAVVPILFALGVLGQRETAGLAPLLLAGGQAIAVVVGLIGLGRLVLRPLFRGVARTRSPELFMAACLLVVLSTGLAAASAGLSMALGSLIAGLLLAETEFRRQIEVTVEPFKGLLVGVFLISIGLSLDGGRVLSQPLAVLGAAVGLVALKAGIVTALARLFRVPVQIGLPAGLLLGPGGEFSFVILGLASSLGLIDPGLGAFAFVVAALTMAATPALSWLGLRIGRPVPTPVPAALLPPGTVPDGARVIIAGFGRVGRTVASLLDAHGLPYIALDSDIGRVAASRDGSRDGNRDDSRDGSTTVYYGDSTQLDLLRHIGLATARALVVTIDDRAQADAVVRLARAERPDLLIVVRARDARHAAHLYALGASDAVPETIEASLQLSEAVLVDLGVPMGPVLVSIHGKRAEFQAQIKAMVPGAPVRSLGQRRLRDAAVRP